MRRLAMMLCLLGGGAAAQGFDQAVRDVFDDDPTAYRWVIERFQAAVRDGDGAAAAALVDYPIEVEVGGRARVIRTPSDFAAGFAAIVTPEIAAAVVDEPVDDMMVTYQGVMLGQGEVWIAGVCDDAACARPEVRVIAIQSVPRAAPPGVGTVKAFHDWLVGCDNANACTAIGLAPEQTGDAYLVLRRDAGPASEATLDAVLVGPDGASDTVEVAVTGKHATPAAVWSAVEDGAWRRASAPASDLAATIAALRDGDEVALGAASAEGPGPALVSLRGATASMLRIDDTQGRVGTVTALARPGDGPPSSVPAALDLPEVEARPIRALDPAPPLPDGVAPAADPSCAGVAPLAWDLGDGATLWAVCDLSGAYNLEMRFWLASAEGAVPAVFDVPGRRDGDAAVLASPGLSDDGRTLTALDLGRGLGDCGEAASWAWTGEGFALVRLAALDTCAGVSPDDWPVLWRTQ